MDHQPLIETLEEIEATRQDHLKEISDDEHFEAARFAPSTFGYHEGMHTASVVVDMVDRNLVEHPAIVLDPKAFEYAYRAFEALWNLYQYMGVRSYQADDEAKAKTSGAGTNSKQD